jgi:hypothetical protein
MTDDTAENPLLKFPRDDCRVTDTAKRDTRSDATRSEERKIESSELSLNALLRINVALIAKSDKRKQKKSQPLKICQEARLGISKGAGDLS